MLEASECLDFSPPLPLRHSFMFVAEQLPCGLALFLQEYHSQERLSLSWKGDGQP